MVMRSKLEKLMDVLYSVSNQCGNGAYFAKPSRITRASNMGWDEALLFLDFLAERNLVKKETYMGDKRSHEGYVMEEAGKKMLKAYGVFKEAEDYDTARDAYIKMCRIAEGDNILKSLEEAFTQRQK